MGADNFDPACLLLASLKNVHALTLLKLIQRKISSDAILSRQQLYIGCIPSDLFLPGVDTPSKEPLARSLSWRIVLDCARSDHRYDNDRSSSFDGHKRAPRLNWTV